MNDETELMPEQEDAGLPLKQAVALRQSPGGAVGPALPPEEIKGPVTAAQAKIEAVAHLTMKAYERASMLQVTPEEVAKLKADFPDEAFKPGASGKEHLIYIEHAYLRDRLNEVFGFGQWSIVPRSRWAEDYRTDKGLPATRVYVEAMLLIRGCFIGEAIGDMSYYPNNGTQNYGDAVEGAKTAALRRCCKELGIGLQAWKKDYCDGWRARKRGNASGAQGGYQPTARGASASPGQAVTRPEPDPEANFEQAAPATVPKKDTEKPVSSSTAAPKQPTAATRAWMIEQLHAKPGGPARDLVTEFFQKVDGLLPNEVLEELPLGFVPAHKADLEALAAAITGFGNGEQAAMPYATPVIGAEKAKKAKAEVPRDKPGTGPKPNFQAEWFMSAVVPVPHKGQPRAEYMQNPDTIGSLYELRHGQDDEAQEARRRLWGFVTNYEPKGWTKRDGSVMPASESDKDFRKALDAFADWFEKNHPGEKL